MTLPSYVVRFLLVFFFPYFGRFFSLHFVSFGDSENFLGLTSSFTSCFYFHMPRSFFSFLPCSIPSQSFVLCISSKHFCKWVRLNYATTHHHHHPPLAKIYPPPPTPPTPTSQNISPLPATTYHQPSAPTASQNISTVTYHFPKNGPPPYKSQNIFIYNLLLTLF